MAYLRTPGHLDGVGLRNHGSYGCARGIWVGVPNFPSPGNEDHGVNGKCLNVLNILNI